MREYTVYEKWLVLLILVNVFPYWWQCLAAIIGAAVLGTIEEFCLFMFERWKARRVRKGA